MADSVVGTIQNTASNVFENVTNVFNAASGAKANKNNANGNGKNANGTNGNGTNGNGTNGNGTNANGTNGNGTNGNAKKANAASNASIFPFVANVMPPANLNNSSNTSYGLIIFSGILIVTILVITRFGEEIQQGYEYIVNVIREFFGYPVELTVRSEIQPTTGNITEMTNPPKNLTPHSSSTDSLVERMLPSPSDKKEVFNVAENTYTYYDAEPLCKALGAELATYDQVKSAWEKGADWCNYGWVKGQMAVFPTQKDTYDSLQSGPAANRSACGTVGINGGHFDNPDLQYGVNCYGKKPKQTAPVDESLPQTPEMVEFNKKVNEFAHESPSTEISPFNEDKWSGSH